MLGPLPFETLVPLQPVSFVSAQRSRWWLEPELGAIAANAVWSVGRDNNPAYDTWGTDKDLQAEFGGWHQSTERNLGLLKASGACGRTEMPAQLLMVAQGLWPAERGELSVLGFTSFLPACIDLVFWQFLDLYPWENIVLTFENTYQRREMILYITSRFFFSYSHFHMV